jgi:hypothetical protein
MRAKRVTKFGFWCPYCNELHTPDEKLEQFPAWRCDEVTQGAIENASEPSYTFSDPEPVNVYLYDIANNDSCIGEDEPEYRDVWRCGQCKTNYLDKKPAKACCAEFAKGEFC